MDSLSPHAQDGNIPEKKCTGPCGRTLPATLEFFHHEKGGKNGLRSQCKKCKYAYNKARLNRPEAREQERARDKIRRSRPERQEYQRSYDKARYSHPEKRAYIHIRCKTYYNRPDVHERLLAKTKVYRNQPEVQEHTRAYHKAYRSQPKGRAIRQVHHHNRRVRQMAVKGNHTPTQIQEQLKRQKYRCYYAACGHAKFQKVNEQYIYHVEHTYPLSRIAGTDIPANDMGYLVLACPSCNMHKGDKFPWEWPEGGRLL